MYSLRFRDDPHANRMHMRRHADTCTRCSWRICRGRKHHTIWGRTLTAKWTACHRIDGSYHGRSSLLCRFSLWFPGDTDAGDMPHPPSRAVRCDTLRRTMWQTSMLATEAPATTEVNMDIFTIKFSQSKPSPAACANTWTEGGALAIALASSATR